MNLSIHYGYSNSREIREYMEMALMTLSRQLNYKVDWNL